MFYRFLPGITDVDCNSCSAGADMGFVGGFHNMLANTGVNPTIT